MRETIRRRGQGPSASKFLIRCTLFHAKVNQIKSKIVGNGMQWHAYHQNQVYAATSAEQKTETWTEERRGIERRATS